MEPVTMAHRFVWSALALGAGMTMVVALTGQGLAVATFVGWLPVSDAGGATSWYAVMTAPWFIIFWLYQMRHEGWHRQRPQLRMHLGAAVREHPIRTLSGLYWVLSFVGLLILGGLDNKGLTVHNGHYYVIHAHGILMPISRAEYQRQAAYPLWMFSAATLFFATLVLGLAVPRSLWASRRIMRLADRYM